MTISGAGERIENWLRDNALQATPCPDQLAWTNCARHRRRSTPPTALLAQGLTLDPLLAHPGHHPAALVASLDRQGPTSELQALIDAVTTGHGIDLYRRI
ncbi:hypothetical protein OHB14_39125 [Streptomyces sp. NBC_01613]|uniref:hypothetical protein n=1 Tax=Streptomyces sp. NBC_01613 TaxID=2975896 RepID=UPI00386EF51D